MLWKKAWITSFRVCIFAGFVVFGTIRTMLIIHRGYLGRRGGIGRNLEKGCRFRISVHKRPWQ